MAEFDEDTKFRVIQALARFRKPAEIVVALAEEGIESDIKQIVRYDPESRYFAASDKWRKVWDDERERYRNDIKAFPIANQAFRLEALQETFDAARKSRNRMLANQTLRQAAEEVGGALTNERVTKTTPLKEMSAAERRAMAAEMIAGLLAQGDPKPSNALAPEMKQ
jgi:hypothetical protein